jgi:hypothetical protein
MAVYKTLVTLTEFRRLMTLPENADRRFELIDGEMVEKVSTLLHAYLIAMLITI